MDSKPCFIDKTVVPGDVVLDHSSMTNKRPIKLGDGLQLDDDIVTVIKAGIATRVVNAKTGTNPELSCIDASGKGTKFGPLKDGFMFESSTGLARMLLRSPACPVVQLLRKKLAFQIVVGLNGRVWFNGEQKSFIILVANAIMNSESLTPSATKDYSCFTD